MQPTIIGVRFTKIGKVYHFDGTSLGQVETGDQVVVDTTRGRHLGEVVQLFPEVPPRPDGGWKRVERRATPRDLLLQQSWQARQTEAMINCRARAAELGLTGIKIVAAEYNYDGSRLTLLFNTASDEKPDLKSLRKDMQAHVSGRPSGHEADRSAGRRQDPRRNGRLRARDSLLLQVPDRLQSDLDQDGEGAGHLADADRDHGHVRHGCAAA